MPTQYYTCPKCKKSAGVYGDDNKRAKYEAKKAEREGRACDECIKKERADEAAIAAKANAAAGLSPIIGTDRQIPWAEKIRSQSAPLIQSILEEIIKMHEEYNDIKPEDWEIISREIEDAEALIRQEMREKTDAAFWIENFKDKAAVGKYVAEFFAGNRDAMPVARSIGYLYEIGKSYRLDYAVIARL